MDVLVLIDKLDDLVHNAKPVPLSDTVRVDKEEIYDILDQMRATIPRGDQAGALDREGTSGDAPEAKREAERIIKEAREKQDQLISDEEVTKQAERAAEDIIEDAPRPRARDPSRRRGLRRRDPQHPLGQPLEVHCSRPARPRAPAGQGRARRSRVGRAVLRNSRHRGEGSGLIGLPSCPVFACRPPSRTVAGKPRSAGSSINPPAIVPHSFDACW